MRVTVALAAAGVTGLCAAQAGLSQERSGLGLKPQGGRATVVADFYPGSEGAQFWQARRRSDFSLYAGARELPLFGPGPAEMYGGIAYALPRGWGSSLEAGYTQESLFAPRRYALTGQVHTQLSAGRALGVGIKYRVYDADIGLRYGAPGDTPVTNGYTLAPSRLPGASLAPAYQMHFSYQHSAASSFGLALGRDVETYTSSFDPTGSASRQITFTGQHWLTPTWALSYDVLSGDLGSPSPLRLQGLGLRLRVRYRF